MNTRVFNFRSSQNGSILNKQPSLVCGIQVINIWLRSGHSTIPENPPNVRRTSNVIYEKRCPRVSSQAYRKLPLRSRLDAANSENHVDSWPGSACALAGQEPFRTPAARTGRCPDDRRYAVVESAPAGTQCSRFTQNGFGRDVAGGKDRLILRVGRLELQENPAWAGFSCVRARRRSVRLSSSLPVDLSRNFSLYPPIHRAATAMNGARRKLGLGEDDGRLLPQTIPTLSINRKDGPTHACLSFTVA
jgi:hypothetical protein